MLQLKPVLIGVLAREILTVLPCTLTVLLHDSKEPMPITFDNTGSATAITFGRQDQPLPIDKIGIISLLKSLWHFAKVEATLGTRTRLACCYLGDPTETDDGRFYYEFANFEST